MKKPRVRRPVIQIDDGEWVEISWRKQREMCCGCHLVHDIDHRIHDGKLQFRATVNARATAAARRGFQFQRDDE